MDRRDMEELVEYEKQIQWQWSTGDPTGYMEALAEDVTYFDPLAEYIIVGREAVSEHFRRIHTGPSGITRQEYRNETAHALGDDEVLLVFYFTTYQQDDHGAEKEFLTWNMSLIFRKNDDRWLLRHGHLSLRDAWKHYDIGSQIGK
jgi:uncharacterized protein (TIGR02246 family)